MARSRSSGVLATSKSLAIRRWNSTHNDTGMDIRSTETMSLDGKAMRSNVRWITAAMVKRAAYSKYKASRRPISAPSRGLSRKTSTDVSFDCVRKSYEVNPTNGITGVTSLPGNRLIS